MNFKSIAVVSLRSAATLFRLQGLADRADALSDLAAGVQSGLDVDEHMAAVAAALASDAPNDWAGVTERIAADRARLHGG